MIDFNKIINKYFRKYFESRYKVAFVLLLDAEGKALDSMVSDILTDICCRYHGLITNYHHRGKSRDVEITVTCTSNEIARLKSELSRKLKGYLI